MSTLAARIAAAFPGAEWSLTGDTYAGLTWYGPGAKPNEADIPASISVPVPSIISTRQFFQQLAKDGDCTEDEALAYVSTGVLPQRLITIIATLPAALRFDVKMQLIGANEFDLRLPIVAQLGQLLGKDASALSRIWRLASAL